MTSAARLVQAGLGANASTAIAGTVADSLTATGTSSQTAALLCGADVNRFSTVAANSGALLPYMNPGDSMVVINAGANALLLYPPVGGKINALGTNAGYSVATATPTVAVTCINSLLYVATQSA
jgi:hypothetical protein